MDVQDTTWSVCFYVARLPTHHCVYSETSKGGEDRLSLWGHFQRAGGANRRCVTCFYTCTRFSNDRRSPVVEMETVVFIFGVVI